MLTVAKPELLKRYGFTKDCGGDWVKPLPVKYDYQPKDNVNGLGDSPDVCLICFKDDGIYKLDVYIEGMNNDYNGWADFDTLARLVADGVASWEGASLDVLGRTI